MVAAARVRACKWCSQPLPVSDHRRRYCSPECRREQRKRNTQRWRDANPGKSVEIAQRWNRAHPARRLATSLAWNSAHPEKTNAANERYRATHRDEAVARSRAWYRANVERARAAARLRYYADVDRHRAESLARTRANPGAHRLRRLRRRALLAGADTRRITPRDWDRLVARHHGCCAYCGERGLLTRDHVIPLARGGRHSIGNLLPACRRCNSSKGDRLLAEWWPSFRLYQPTSDRVEKVAS